VVTIAGIGAFIYAIQSVVSAPSRLNNQRKDFLISSLLNGVLYYILVLGFVHYFRGYWSMIFSALISSIIVLLYFSVKNRVYFKLFSIDINIMKRLFRVGIPLLPIFIIYWFFQANSKIAIANYCGLSEQGIFSIALKVASISEFIQVSFSSGYSYFTFSTMKDKDQMKLKSILFEYLGIISFLSLFILIFLNKQIFSILFDGDFSKGYIVFPYLFISPFILILYQIIANQFTILRKSYFSTVVITSAALLNYFITPFLTKEFGIEGAASAQLLSYLFCLIFLYVIANKMGIFKVSVKFIIVFALFIVFIVLYFLKISNILIFAPILFLTFLFAYFSEFSILINRIKNYY